MYCLEYTVYSPGRGEDKEIHYVGSRSGIQRRFKITYFDTKEQAKEYVYNFLGCRSMSGMPLDPLTGDIFGYEFFSFKIVKPECTVLTFEM